MVGYNFKTIHVVPTGKEFIDVILSKTQRKTPTVVHPGYKISRIRNFYMRKVKFTEQNFREKFQQILEDFPRLEDIHPFYADLMNVLYDKDHYKLALGHVHSAKALCEDVAKDYVRLLKYGDSLYRCKMLKRAALGRMCTIVKKLNASLSYLEEVRKHLARMPSIDPNTRTLMMCGYPNVGKSSMINVLCAEKRVGVAAQPGKTKHFQTLQVGEKVTLCDCPGLVFPSFIVTRAEMVCSGVLPIDQLREFKSPVSLICQRLPRGVFEEVLRINIPPLKKDDDAATRISAEYMMQSYARCRGYFTGRGIPDESRVARMVLKEYTTGGLLFCHLPPTSKIRGLDAVALYYPFPSLLTALENKAKAAAAAAAVEDPNVFSAELREENEIESEKTFANEMMYPKEAGKPDKKHRPWKKEKKLMKNLRSQANFVYKDEVSFEHQNGVAARTAGRNGVANYIRTQYPFGRPAAASGTAPHPNSVPASSSSSSSAADAQAVKGKGRAVVFA
eukprot:GILI01001890.1.p1 GENE.GILI01001890.1~~GILI01001890.1.p1  ORF type:complete len:504 (+),score=149.09 GILI01001890.1:109-1620(+)